MRTTCNSPLCNVLRAIISPVGLQSHSDEIDVNLKVKELSWKIQWNRELRWMEMWDHGTQVHLSPPTTILRHSRNTGKWIMGEGEEMGCVWGGEREIVNYHSALHLKVIRILHFFCAGPCRKTRDTVGWWVNWGIIPFRMMDFGDLRCQNPL